MELVRLSPMIYPLVQWGNPMGNLVVAIGAALLKSMRL
jgi:hypothetical protein